jgi:hypothetical protein
VHNNKLIPKNLEWNGNINWQNCFQEVMFQLESQVKDAILEKYACLLCLATFPD